MHRNIVTNMIDIVRIIMTTQPHDNRQVQWRFKQTNPRTCTYVVHVCPCKRRINTDPFPPRR